MKGWLGLTLAIRCWFGHTAILEQRRDLNGLPVKPHVVDWRCARCQRVIGETKLGANWGLLTRLRRQAAWKQAERRRA